MSVQEIGGGYRSVCRRLDFSLMDSNVFLLCGLPEVASKL